MITLELVRCYIIYNKLTLYDNTVYKLVFWVVSFHINLGY